MKQRFLLKNRLAEIKDVIYGIVEFGEAHSISGDIADGLHLAVDEVLTNIISYAYNDDAEHMIAVTVDVQNDRLIIEIEDDGKASNPIQDYRPDRETPFHEREEIGGYGIVIVRRVMDELAYRRQGGKKPFHHDKVQMIPRSAVRFPAMHWGT